MARVTLEFLWGSRARLLGVIAVHRRSVAQRVEVRQAQLAALHLARDVVGVEYEVATSVGLEELRQRWSAVRRAGALLGAVERAQHVSAPAADPRAEDVRLPGCARRRGCIPKCGRAGLSALSDLRQGPSRRPVGPHTVPKPDVAPPGPPGETLVHAPPGFPDPLGPVTQDRHGLLGALVIQPAPSNLKPLLAATRG
jgi:hypothetical protein